MTQQSRRNFLETCTLGAGAMLIPTMYTTAFSAENQAEIGKALPAWQEGTMDLHFIYTGVGENMFYIFPDGTTMVLDASDRPSNQEDQFPIKPNKTRLPSEWIARYIQRVSPSKDRINYMMLSHYHEDHAGSHRLSAGKTWGRGTDYYLSGLANLGEFFKFDKVFDRGYPDYDRPKNKKPEDGFENFKKFCDWKIKNKEFTMEKFEVGKLDQIVLCKKRKQFSDFHIRNICSSGEVWTGKEGKTIDFLNPLPKHYISENMLSMALRIDFGPFRYFTGGDLSGAILDDKKVDRQLEAAAGKAAGEVDVCKVNHHSYRDAMRAEFTREVRANVYVVNVWDYGHLQDNTMTNMTDPKICAGDKMVCHTWVSKNQMELYKDKEWQKYLKPAYGHIVVRVFDGGRQYKIYYLTAEDESMTVKTVFGPFKAKKN